MKIAVIGTGYVGLVVGACLAETGNDVICADVDEAKIEGLLRNQLPIYEPGLEELVSRNQASGRLAFSTDLKKSISGASVVFIAVGTPPDEDGSADLRHVLDVAAVIGDNLTNELVVVTKSTVPVGTAARVSEVIEKRAKFPVHLCSNPEFLKEGAAVDDFMKPDRVVLGVESDFARSVMAELYAPFVRTGKPILFMDIPSAEMTKYAANAMLATRISFMNEIANLCERTGADVDMVRRGIGSDSRIGSSFLFPGPGYGGSCFPKDVRALVHTSRSHGSPCLVLEAVSAANERQKGVLFEKVMTALNGKLEGAVIAVWGLAFKPQTDDLRESPALVLIDQLLEAGAKVVAHDPAAMPSAAGRIDSRVTLAPTNYDAAQDADALVVVTDWNEYRHPDFERIGKAMRRQIIVDGRNLYDRNRLRQHGFIYFSIGRAPISVVRSTAGAASA
jgi:UDPglucose 6-dehydrogenase